MAAGRPRPVLALLLAALPAAYGAPTVEGLKQQVMASTAFKQQVNAAMPVLCKGVPNQDECKGFVADAIMCLELAQRRAELQHVPGAEAEHEQCKVIDKSMPSLSLLSKILAMPSAHRNQATLLQQTSRIQSWAREGVRAARLRRGGGLRREAPAPERQLAEEMTHDLEMNFNKIAPFGKEDTAKELQDHAAKTQDTLVDAVENAEVAEIKRAVFRALTRLRAATIKEFDTIARLETQAIDAYNDAHHYRAENPLAHLHEDEAPVETDKLKSFH
mmetsp:Transcript_53752/g.129480  ORF Transcript_53752/g.129480 Transcript_53752/m.129480 type:complete len:274 (-) Transcript_53752:1-822(-)